MEREENFVMLLYFVAVGMSIEDQPFNELPALISSKVRRFFMKYVPFIYFFFYTMKSEKERRGEEKRKYKRSGST
jgi:hypothetical protein